jgi:cell division protein FtsB
MSRFAFIPRRILTLIGLATLFLIIIGFSRRISEFARLSNQLDLESARITELVATQSHLQGQIAYATSEAAVEEWAREDNRLAQPGDFVVIPLQQEGAQPLVVQQAQSTQQVLSNWQTWMQWFFYDGP